jgi:hypothetical protein
MHERRQQTPFVVYTALFGDYEVLTEQPIASEGGTDFVCFTDNPDLRSTTWDVRVVEPLLPADPVRSSRWPKIMPHRVLPEYERSLYIDNSVLLLAPPGDLFRHLVPDGFDMGVFGHSFRRCLDDEFDAVLLGAHDAPLRVHEQRSHYRQLHGDRLDQPVTSNGILARHHHRPVVVAAMEQWMAHVLRYSRRDQLSSPVTVGNHPGLELHVATGDNYGTPFHRWPVVASRNRERTLPFDPAEQLVVENAALRRQLAALEAELAATRATWSWRVTTPLRRVRTASRRPR